MARELDFQPGEGCRVQTRAFWPVLTSLTGMPSWLRDSMGFGFRLKMDKGEEIPAVVVVSSKLLVLDLDLDYVGRLVVVVAGA